MSDLRSRLERLGDRVRSAPDAFERLERSRRRRDRNRRITAGAVALLVAVAGTVAAYAAFRQPGGSLAAAGGGTGTVTVASAGVAEFTCDPTGTIAPSFLSVDAQPDGVHVAVTNLARERIRFTVGGGDRSTMYAVGQGGADPGERKEIVVGAPPGDAHVSCRLDSAGAIDTSPMADLQVQDPAGVYVPIGLDCPLVSQGTDDATGYQGDPVGVAKQHLSGLEYDDTVERASYANGDQPVVRVVRNGDVVAVASFRGDETDGWRIGSLVTCVDVLVGWSREVTGVSGPIGSTSPASTWDEICSTVRANGPDTDHNGSDLRVEDRGNALDTRCLIAPAGEPISITLRNGDAEILRNLSVYQLTPYLRECIVTATAPSQDTDHSLFEAESVVGPAETTYRVGPLEPGEYYFQDDLHPSLNGVLIVE
jgi:hypothetical protein